MPKQPKEIIEDPARLKGLQQTGLLDSVSEERYDRLTRLGTKVLNVPVALVSLVDKDRQFFKSSVGLPAEVARVRQTPLSHSFCQHVVSSGEPLVVCDARIHPVVRDNLAVPDLGVVAYCGIPLITAEGQVIGSFCAIDNRPHQWTTDEIDILKHLAASVMVEMGLTRAKEEAEAANKAKDRFLAMLSHELRTPISPALMIVTAMAQDQTLRESTREDARTVQRNIEHQTRLIDDLLDIARIENGKFTLETQPVDLHSIIRDGLRMCGARAAEKGLSLVLELKAERHMVLGDRNRLQQVCCNLVTNAIKFTPAPGSITVATGDGSAGTIVLSVSDTGIGIEPEMLPKIFNTFEQGRRAITEQYSGLGLGLAICKGIVEAHDGTIRAESNGRGLGTTIRIEMANALSQTPEIEPKLVDAASVSEGLNILLVDDHHDTLRVMSRLLRGLKHRVTTADSVNKALEAASNDRFDLLISDVGLPDGTGHELMRQIVASRPIKGIALTGYGTEADVQEAREAGFAAHITKPVNFQNLEMVIRQIGVEAGEESGCSRPLET